MFEINGKVALISGGASGLGLKFAQELLRHGLKGVTLADVNSEFGQKALVTIEQEFGKNKALFVVTDVTDKRSYKEAFRRTIEVFQNLDIVVNNAGIMNDAMWEKQIAINLNGVVHGTILGLENYIPKYKTGSGGVIVNLSSVAALEIFSMVPIYSGTKLAVLGISKAFGDEAHYERTKVKVLALCPGATETPLLTQLSGRNLGQPYQQLLEDHIDDVSVQRPESVAAALIKVIQKASTGTIWVVEHDQEPSEYVIPARRSYTLEIN